MTTQDEQTKQKKDDQVVLPITLVGNGKMKQIELSKKEWSLTRENHDRWLFTEVRL